MLCPMIPFLDPASNLFEYPGQTVTGYSATRLRSIGGGMERASLINRINCETKWLWREDLVYLGFKAVRRLMEANTREILRPLFIPNLLWKSDSSVRQNQ